MTLAIRAIEMGSPGDPGMVWCDFVWRQFAANIGAEALLACYGWQNPPESLRPGETAWAYYADGLTGGRMLIGWGSLIKDPTTPTYWHTSGVFPAFQRQGYRQAIRQHLCGEAFARGAEAVSLVVLDGNKDHLARLHREDRAGSPWKFSGRIWSPEPGQWIFTLLRKDFLRACLSCGHDNVGHIQGVCVVGASPCDCELSYNPLIHSPGKQGCGPGRIPDESLPSLLAREKVCCCFHLNMPDAEPACGQG